MSRRADHLSRRSDRRPTEWLSRIALSVLFALAATTCVTAQSSDREARAQMAAKIASLRPLAQQKLAEIIAAVDRDGDTTAREETAETTRYGARFRYRQLHHRVSVEGARVTISITNGRVSTSGTFKAGLNVNPLPNVPKSDAERIVRERMRANGALNIAVELKIYPKGNIGDGLNETDRLFWDVEAWTRNDEDADTTRKILIDAHTGEVVADDPIPPAYFTYVMDVRPLKGAYTGSTGPLIVAKVTLNKVGEWKTYTPYLADPCYGTGFVMTTKECGTIQQVGNVQTFVPHGVGNYVANAGGTSKTTGKMMQIDKNPFGDGVLGSSDPRTVAADTFFYMGTVFDYVFLNFDHLGLNKSNSPQIHAMINTAVTNSSFWHPKDQALVVASQNATYFDMASLDIIAHELGHAFNTYGPNLTLFQKGAQIESPKIAEAMGDILAMVVGSVHPYHDPVPHWIGEKAIRANYAGTAFVNNELALRYMDDPARHPGDVACYYPGIAQLEHHRGAGPANHMFYLLVNGGVSRCNGLQVEGVGMTAAANIYWEAFLDLPSDATYPTLRSKFLEKAMELHPGPNQIVLSTAAAFDAVNVN